MSRLVFVESSCLVDTWTMATRLVRSVRRCGAPDAIGVLEAESARGTDLVSVHRALWALLDGYDYRTLAELPACPAVSCLDRDDTLGRAAVRALRWHRRVGDRIVVVSDLMALFARPLQEHLHVDRVLCGGVPVDAGGRAAGRAEVLLGAAAAQAVELAAVQESVALADCVAYGRDPRDRELLGVVGHGVRIGYDGELRPPAPSRIPRSGQEHAGTSQLPARPAPRPPGEPAELAAG